MRSSGRNEIPHWFQNNGIWFYVIGTSAVGSVSWKRYPDSQYSMDKIVWVACFTNNFSAYAEFDTEEEAKAYVMAIVSLEN